MSRNCAISIALLGILIMTSPVLWAVAPELSGDESREAAANYQKYCVLCHGADREGYANDDAPSLRSKSLIISGFPNHLALTIGYGRHGTPMAGYLDEVGGPLSEQELMLLVYWLKDQVGVDADEQFPSVVTGNAARGEQVYARECSMCHGESGEGDVGPAIGNPAMLTVTTDNFLRYAIENGRDGTDMPAFGEILSAEDIDGVTAFLRSRAAGWERKSYPLQTPPPVDDYVLNPGSPAPEFELKDGLYVMAADLQQALQEKRRLVLLDTRVPSAWQMAHIAGSVPIPYYKKDFDDLSKDLPDDGTWIVTYCECPRAAAESVTRKLRAQGFKNTAVLWEGVQGWASLGYPVSVGQIKHEPKDP